jgi:hypothetical protein
MAWYQNDDGEWYSDEMLYGDTTGSNNEYDNGTSIVGDPNADSLVNTDSTFDLNPTSSEDISKSLTDADKAVIQSYSNANTATSGGPAPVTDYLGALISGVKAGTVKLSDLSTAVQSALSKAVTNTAAAAPSFLNKIGDFLKTDTGKAIGIGGLATLLQSMGNKGTGEIYKGYQGGIPMYTADRTMNAIPTTSVDAAGKTVARRPGQGGITYFSPMQYTPGDYKLVAPATATTTNPATTTTTDTVNKAMGGIAGYAMGGLSSLGGYSDGGRLLRGPGDGVSDSIPATIGQKQPARLADGEFVVPARIVSEIGNGSTEAGARKLYAMMDRVQKARGKTLKNVAANPKADKYLPA